MPNKKTNTPTPEKTEVEEVTETVDTTPEESTAQERLDQRTSSSAD